MEIDKYIFDKERLKELNLDVYFEFFTILRNNEPLVYSLTELEEEYEYIIKRMLLDEEKKYSGLIKREIKFEDYFKDKEIEINGILKYIGIFLHRPPRIRLGYRIPPKGHSYNYKLLNEEGQHIMIVSNLGDEYRISIIADKDGNTKVHKLDTRFKLKKILLDIYKHNKLIKP